MACEGASGEFLHTSLNTCDIKQNLTVSKKGKLKWKGSLCDLQSCLIRELGIQANTKWSTPGGY